MGLTADFCIIMIIAISIFIGVKRGFIYSAAKFAGAILASVFAAMLSGPVATWIFETFFREAFLEKAQHAVLGAADATDIAAVLGQFPNFLVRILAERGMTEEVLAQKLATRQGDAAVLIVDAISPVLISFLEVLVAIVLFFLLLILVRVVASMLNGVFKLPVLNQMNKLLGGITGLFTGILTVWLILAVFQVFIPAFTGEGQNAVNQFFQSSIIAKFFKSLNPMSLLF